MTSAYEPNFGCGGVWLELSKLVIGYNIEISRSWLYTKGKLAENSKNKR
jgi:hypothetical protein